MVPNFSDMKFPDPSSWKKRCSWKNFEFPSIVPCDSFEHVYFRDRN